MPTSAAPEPPLLRIAARIHRGRDLQQDIWRSAQRVLAKIPGCLTAVFDRSLPVEQIRAWRPTGLLIHAEDPSDLEVAAFLKVPAVNTSGVLEPSGLPSVLPDSRAVGELAAHHLLDLGFRRFGFVGDGSTRYARERADGFAAILSAAGMEVDVFPGGLTGVPAAADWRPDRPMPPLGRWLSGLPPETALFVAADEVGAEVIALLQSMGIDPSDRFAILSGHDRQFPCQPPLSAIRLPEEAWGAEAARLLVDLLRGEPAPANGAILLPPLGVAERESTLGPAGGDDQVRSALRFIRQHAGVMLGVDDVVAATGLGRRALERRFHDRLGRTILTEIHRAHLRRAKALLAETDLPMNAVANEAGLTDDKHLLRLFQAEEATSPGAYRRRVRGGGQ